MTPACLKERLRGVVAFTPTPFTPDDRVDLAGLAWQVDFLCRSGAHVVVVCGGIGEFFSLDLDEYRNCIRVGVEAAAGRLPLLAGIGHSTRTASRLAAHAASVAVDGMMMFSTRGNVYTPGMVERLAEIDEVIALKDELGDLKLFIETKDRLGSRLAWINGMAETLAAPYFAAGAAAFTSGIVNFAPKLSLAVWEAGCAGRWDELNAVVATNIRPLARLRERRNGYHIAVVKEAMNLLGLPGGEVRPPLLPVAEEDREELRRILATIGLPAHDA